MVKILSAILTAIALSLSNVSEAGPSGIFSDGSRSVIAPYHLKTQNCLLHGVARVALNESIDSFTVVTMFGNVISVKNLEGEVLDNANSADMDFVFEGGEISIRNHKVTRIKMTVGEPVALLQNTFTSKSFLSTSLYAPVGASRDRLIQSYGNPKSVHKIVDYELLRYEGTDNYLDAVIDSATNKIKSIEIGLL